MDEINGMNLNDFMDQNMVISNIVTGDTIKGKVIQITDEYAVLDINYKSEGYLPLREDKLVTKKFSYPNIDVGEELEVMVDRINNREGIVYLSLEKARFEKILDRLSKAFKNKEAAYKWFLE